MNMQESFTPSAQMTSSAPAPTRSSWLGLVRHRFVAWVKSYANYWTAAAAYEQLSRLSDAELKHRGLSRDILARDL